MTKRNSYSKEFKQQSVERWLTRDLLAITSPTQSRKFRTMQPNGSGSTIMDVPTRPMGPLAA